MKNIILLFILAVTIQATAQKFPYHKNYKWEKNPTLIDRDLKDPVYYYNQYDIAVEYIFDDVRGTYSKYETNHYRIFLNSDAAVEEFNKVYISLEDVHNVLNLKARLIKVDGVVDIKPEIEEFYNEEDHEEYYYFPISGMEVGDELEIIYTLKMAHFLNGDQFVMQGEYPMYNSNFYMICPTYFKFDFETYNGYPKPQHIDTILQVRQYYSHLDSVPVFKAEYFSEFYNSVYKIDASLYSIEDGGYFERYYPYEGTVNYMNEFYNLPIKKGIQKKVLKQMMAFGYEDFGNEEKNIRIIENFIKRNINYSSKFQDLGLLETLNNERSSIPGVIKLYKAFFDIAGIDYKYGYIADRYDTYFSDEIESDFFLQSYIFYFPDTDKYMSPLDFTSRLGFVSSDWVPNNAMLMTEFKTGVRRSTYEVSAVPAVDYRDNYDSTVMKIKLADNLMDLDISIEVYMTGYDAGEIQSFYYLYSPNRKEKEMKDVINFMGDRSVYKVTEMQNTEPEDAFIKPLIVKGNITQLSTHLIEKADGKTIFRLGNVFGDGIELKEVRDRQTDFTFANAFHETKTIIIELPDGLEVTNLVNIQEFDTLVDMEGFSLSSHITVTDGKIVYVKKNAFKKQKYSIEEQENMIKIFQFYNDIYNMNIILE